MLRFEISEEGHGPLPAIDIADATIVIGSGEAAQIRLPAEVASAAHIQIDGPTWTLLAESKVGGLVRAAGDSGSVGRGLSLEFGKYRVRVCTAPAGSVATPRQRTESLARELVRGLLGEGAAPSLEIERGPGAGTRRALPPPEATLVIGRGDEATWVILDADLSRTHAEIRRGWDGVTIVDLGSKNGTRVEGHKIGAEPVELHDGDLLTLGDLVLRFRDPAEAHLGGESPAARTSPRASLAGPATSSAPNPWLFFLCMVIAGLAIIGL